MKYNEAQKRTARFILRWLGERRESEINDRPPGSTQHLRFGEIELDDGIRPYVATTDVNDGFELWLGTMHEWHVYYRHDQARKLAIFILWDWWFKGTWCGLKRWLWYKALHINTFDMMKSWNEKRLEEKEYANPPQL